MDFKINLKKKSAWIAVFSIGCIVSMTLSLYFKEYAATILFMGGYFTDKLCNAVEN